MAYIVPEDALVSTGLVGASVSSVTPISSSLYRVDLNTGQGEGTVGIRVLAANSILDLAGNAMLSDHTSSPVYTIDRTAPSIVDVFRVGPSPTRAATVDYIVTLSEAVINVDVADFDGVASPTLTGSFVESVTGSGSTYTVRLSTGAGVGNLAVSALPGGVTDLAGNVWNASSSVLFYLVDKVAPTISSIAPSTLGPTTTGEITYSVTLSESVTGVGIDDFSLISTGAISGSITNISGIGQFYTVTVNTGTEDGTLRLDFIDNDSVIDPAGNPVGGDGLGNGNYSSPTTVFKRTVDIGGTVWNDLNADGVRDPGELPLTGVIVYLDLDNNGAWDAGSEPSQVSDSNGGYLFGSQQPGEYFVGIQAAEDLQQTAPAKGGPGRLTHRSTDIASGSPALVSPRAVAMRPDGKFVYAAGHVSNSLNVYSIDAVSGSMTLAQTVVNSTVALTERMSISADGKFLYTISGPNSQIGVYAIHAQTGQVTLNQTLTNNVGGVTGINGTRSITISPDGLFAYVGGISGLAVFSRNPTFGQLTYLSSISGLGAVLDLSVSPDNLYLYAVENLQNLRVYQRNTTSGGITLVQTVTDGINGVTTLQYPISVTTSPDSGFIYVGALADNAVTVFSRSSNGQLTQVQALVDGQLGSSRLYGVSSVELSPDGKRLYVAAQYDSTLNVFTRDQASGQLTLLEEIQQSDSPSAALIQADQIAISSDGKFVAVTSYDLDAVNIFQNGYGFPIPKPHYFDLQAGTVISLANFGLQDLNPVPLSLTAQSANNSTNASLLAFNLQLSESVSGVDLSDFSLALAGIAGANIVGVSGSGRNYQVSVSIGAGDGTIRLSLNDDDSIVDTSGDPLGGLGTGSEVFSSATITIDRTVPQVIGITALDPLVSRDSTVRFSIAFSEPIVDLDASDFEIVTTGTKSEVGITAITGAGSSYVIHIATGVGNGNIGLNLVDNDSIADQAGNWLGGNGTGNGSYFGTAFYASEMTGESKIQGTKWHDLDEDGVIDLGEPPLSGWTVYADNNLNGLLDVGEPIATTGPNGAYEINWLFSGAYIIREIPQSGWEQKYPRIGNFPVSRVSLNSAGIEGTGSSDLPSVSADGRFVAFLSSSGLTGGANANGTIFVKDRSSGTVERISNGLAGAAPNNSSDRASISSDGRYVAFTSFASNLVSGDTNNASDIFLFDRQTQTTTRLSVASDGAQANGASSNVEISGDGRFVTFQSSASNLVASDGNGQSDIFVHELSTGITSLVSRSSAGVQANNLSLSPSISYDGNVIAFESDATNLVAFDTNGYRDIFVHTRSTGVLQRVSQVPSGPQANSSSQGASVSGNGNYVAFWTNANNLVPGSTTFPDVLLVDLAANTIETVSKNSAGASTGFAAARPSISFDGRQVAFGTSSSVATASNLFDVFVRDRFTNKTRLISQSVNGILSGGASNFFDISADGKSVVFSSDAKHLVPSDNNYVRDIFVTDVSMPWIPGSHPVVIGVSSTVTNVDFANTEVDGSVSGSIWQDIDRDGVRDLGEPPISGRQVFVDMNNDGQVSNGEPVAVSNSLGEYAFDGIPSGNYAVREVLPTDWVEYLPSTGNGYSRIIGSPRTVLFDFENLAHSSTSFVNIGNYEREGFVFSTSVSGSSQFRVYSTASGRPSTELDVANGLSTQYLQRLDGAAFTASSLVAKSPTGTSINFVGQKNDGAFIYQSFGLTSTNTTLNLSGFSNLKSLRWFGGSSASIAVDNFLVTTVDWEYPSSNFGSMGLPGNISGQVFHDSNSNGLLDSGEAPIVGRRVYLDINNNGVREGNEPSVTSASNGNFILSNVNPATYRVRQELPLDWTESVPGSGYTIDLQPNQTLNNILFGSWPAASEIRGTKWHDLNANGFRDTGEPGLSGWTVYLDIDNDGVLDSNEPLTTTVSDDPSTAQVDETGNYRFENVMPGTYVVREVLQSNWLQTSPIAAVRTLEHSQNIRFAYSGFIHHPDADQALNLDGRYLAFSSPIANVASDTNSTFDIYVLDRQTNLVELVSTGSNGQIGNSGSYEPSISDDGRYVAFRSFATNFANSGPTGRENIFVRDRLLGTTTLVTFGATAASNGNSKEPILTADGRQVVFWSYASNLVSDDTNNLADLFIYSLDTGVTSRLTPNDRPVNLNDENVYGADISANGRFVAFQSFSDNIIAGDFNGTSDIFVLDRQSGVIERVSTNSNGAEANGSSEKRSISDDGRFIVFDSTARNLTDDFFDQGYNVFLKDRLTGETRLISRTPSGAAANGSRRPEMSGDGRWITFETTSQTLLPDSANTTSDIILYDRLTDRLERISRGTTGGPCNFHSVNPVISRDGSTITFNSSATNFGLSGTGLITSKSQLNFNATLANSVRVIAGQVHDKNDLGNHQLVGQISGIQFDDINGNGIQDIGELGVSGVTVYLDANNNGHLDTGESSVITSANGQYSFSSLLPRSYSVKAQTSDRSQTSPIVETPRIFGAFTQADSTSSTGYRAGFIEFNPNNGSTIRTVTTNIQSSPSLLGLAYNGQHVLLLNSANATLYEMLPDGQIIDQSVVPASATSPTLLFSGLASIQGRVFYLDQTDNWPNVVEYDIKTNQLVRRMPLVHDLNGYDGATFPTFGLGLGESSDGQSLIISTADTSVADRRLLRVDPNTGRVVEYFTWNASMPTDTGITSFAGETYISVNSAQHIQVYSPTGALTRTFAASKFIYGLGGAVERNGAASIIVSPQQPVIQQDFGQRLIRASVQGKLFEDRNNNDLQEVGEPAIAGATVYLDQNQNRQLDVGEQSTITAINGEYAFSVSTYGDFVVRVLDVNGLAVSSSSNSARLFAVRVAGAQQVIQELNPLRGTVIRQYPVPDNSVSSTAAGLAFDGVSLFYNRAGSNLLYEIAPDTGMVIRTSVLPSTIYDGLAEISGKLYLLDVVSDSILEIERSTGDVLRTLNINAINPDYLGPGTSINLAFSLSESSDRTSLIAVDQSNRRYLINPVNGQILSSGTGSFAGGTGMGQMSYSTIYNSSLMDVRNANGMKIGQVPAGTQISALGGAISNDQGRPVRLSAFQELNHINLVMRDVSTPSDILLNKNTIAENQPSGALVGLLSAVDANAFDTHTFTLVVGVGDTDNGSFQIVSNQLRSTQSFDYSLKQSYSIRVRTTDASGHEFEKTIAISVENIPELVGQVQIGDGTAQRSLVRQVVLEIDGAVQIDADAFIVQKRERNSQGNLVLQPVGISWSTSILQNGNTRVTLGFSGAYTRSGTDALVDGNYQLTIDSSKIRASGTTQNFDGNGDGLAGGNLVLGADQADKFFAFYGDVNGDRLLNLVDYTAFRNAYGKTSGSSGYRVDLDFNLDGSINLLDYTQFRNRYGTSFPFF